MGNAGAISIHRWSWIPRGFDEIGGGRLVACGLSSLLSLPHTKNARLKLPILEASPKVNRNVESFTTLVPI